MDQVAERLREAARMGELLDFAPDRGDDALDPSSGRSWPSEQHVPADVLRSLLTDPELNADPRGLRLRGAFLPGTLDLRYVTVPCPLALIACCFEEVVMLDHARLPLLDLRRSHLPGIDLNGARVDGVAALDQLTVEGKVRAVAAHVGAQFSMGRASLINEGGTAFIFDQIQIAGNAFLDGLAVKGEVRGVGAYIGGQLSFQNAELTNDGAIALHLDEAHVNGIAALNRTTVRGGVQAIGAHVGGQLSLKGARLINEGGTAFIFDQARLDGGAFLDGLAAKGEMRAIGAHVGGQLSLKSARLMNGGGIALALDQASLDGGAFLDGLSALGEVSLVGAQVGGQLGLNGGRLINEGGIALRLDRAHIDDDAFLDGLTALGEVSAGGAQVDGQLSLGLGAAIINDGQMALAAEQLAAGRLWLRGIGELRGELNLVGAHIGDLVVDKERPAGGLPGRLAASGWRVDDMHGVLRTDRRAAVEWLATAREFVPQPWHALAAVYERNGQPEDARSLRRQAAHRTTRAAPLWAKPVRYAYGALVGYGYSPLWAAGWLLAAVLAAFVLSDSRPAAFVPSDPSAAASALAPTSVTGGTTAPPMRAPAKADATGSEATAGATGATSCTELGGRYPCFRPVLYSLDVVLPPNIATGQADAWRPSSAWLAVLLSMLKTFGWLLTALLLAGVTGLLRRT